MPHGCNNADRAQYRSLEDTYKKKGNGKMYDGTFTVTKPQNMENMLKTNYNMGVGFFHQVTPDHTVAPMTANTYALCDMY